MAVKVLVVENNPVARAFLSRVIRESFSDDIEIAEAADLESAGQQLAASPKEKEDKRYKLILVDLELPGNNGLKLLAMLTEYPAIKIVTTLYSDDDTLFPALQCGGDGYLLKEDRFEVVVEELQKIVRGQPPLSPAIARRLLALFRGENDSGFPSSRPTPLPATGTPGPESLSPRENEVLTYLSKGFTIKEIANLMGIKWLSVNAHIKDIYTKFKRSQSSAQA